MQLLALSTFLEDPSAALLTDGCLSAVVEEGRLRRHQHGTLSLGDASVASNDLITGFGSHRARFFPSQSVDACLTEADLSRTDVDAIAVGFDPTLHADPDRVRSTFPSRPPEVADEVASAFRAMRDRVEHLARRCGAEVSFVRHHRAHAYGAVGTSPFERCNVLTVDGMGEAESATLWAFDGAGMEQLVSVPLPHSIGRVYSSGTQYLGFSANRHEGKVMALAGYGEPTFADDLGELVWTTQDGFEIEPGVFWTEECGMGFTNASPLPKVFGAPARSPDADPLQDPYPDVAASLQEVLFEVTSHLVRLAHERTGYTNLAMSGGVALNCENNGRLLTELDCVEEVHVQPQAHDAGVALGAAFAVHHDETGELPDRVDHVFHGPSFPADAVRDTLDDCKLDYTRPDDLPAAVADRLADGDVVGFFQGRMEAGPRALGARSILASPAGEGAARYVNQCVKDRETWRPFAPTILHEHRDRYLAVEAEDPYMTLALPVTDRAGEELASAVHVTGTTRPQTLKREHHPLYYETIEAFHRRTGIPAVLNTSFNVSGEPIVCRPREAIRDFTVTGMDALALGPFLLEKEG